MKTLVIFTDGGARNNPGPAGIGVVFYDDNGNLKYTHKEYLGIKTNNQAEYAALICALEKAREFEPEKIIVNLDSKLITEQLNGNYKVKNSGLKELFWQARTLVLKFGQRIELRHIPRSKNTKADSLVNQAIDEKLKKTKNNRPKT